MPFRVSWWVNLLVLFFLAGVGNATFEIAFGPRFIPQMAGTLVGALLGTIAAFLLSVASGAAHRSFIVPGCRRGSGDRHVIKFSGFHVEGPYWVCGCGAAYLLLRDREAGATRFTEVVRESSSLRGYMIKRGRDWCEDDRECTAKCRDVAGRCTEDRHRCGAVLSLRVSGLPRTPVSRFPRHCGDRGSDSSPSGSRESCYRPAR